MKVMNCERLNMRFIYSMYCMSIIHEHLWAGKRLLQNELNESTLDSMDHGTIAVCTFNKSRGLSSFFISNGTVQFLNSI